MTEQAATAVDLPPRRSRASEAAFPFGRAQPNAALFSHVLFPTYVGLLLWGGLVLRNQRLRALVLPSN